MKPKGGGEIPGELEKKIVADLGSVDKMKEDFIQAGVTQFGSGWCLARRQGRQDRRHEDAERRKPAGARRHADPRRATCGSTPTTSTTATAGPTISRRSSRTW